VALWFCISVPLVFLGSILGYRKPPIELPVRTALRRMPAARMAKAFTTTTPPSPVAGFQSPPRVLNNPSPQLRRMSGEVTFFLLLYFSLPSKPPI